MWGALYLGGSLTPGLPGSLYVATRSHAPWCAAHMWLCGGCHQAVFCPQRGLAWRGGCRQPASLQGGGVSGGSLVKSGWVAAPGSLSLHRLCSGVHKCGSQSVPGHLPSLCHPVRAQPQNQGAGQGPPCPRAPCHSDGDAETGGCSPRGCPEGSAPPHTTATQTMAPCQSLMVQAWGWQVGTSTQALPISVPLRPSSQALRLHGVSCVS